MLQDGEKEQEFCHEDAAEDVMEIELVDEHEDTTAAENQCGGGHCCHFGVAENHAGHERAVSPRALDPPQVLYTLVEPDLVALLTL